jgi:hypothetical protein
VLRHSKARQQFKTLYSPERLGAAFGRNPRRRTHLYFYYLDRDFGLMHVRLQTWFPFSMQVCLNGREWLARQMDHAGLGYEQAIFSVEASERTQYFTLR